MRIALPLPVLQRLACTVLVIAILSIGGATAQSPSPPPAPSEDAALRARHLDALFVHLKAVTVEEEADAMVAEIWKLWLQSGRPEMDALMEQAVALLPELTVPEPTVVPLERFEEGLRLFREGAVSKVVLVFLASALKFTVVIIVSMIFGAFDASAGEAVGTVVLNAALTAALAPPVFALLAGARLTEEREA